MNFTVLGASGFVGRHLVESLCRAGHAVQAPAKGTNQAFERPLGNVMYCIGMTADFRTRPFDTARAHLAVLADVLEKAEFDSLVYLSSTRVYARSASSSESATPMVDVSDPSDLYNISKLAGESLCRSCGRPNVKVARLSNVVGPDPASENFLSTLIREALSGRIELQSDPASEKDYILLADVMDLLPKIAVDGREWIYNVASGINIPHRAIVDRLAALTGCEVAVRPDAGRSGFPLIDISRIRSEFGFHPAPVLDELPRLIERFQAGAEHHSKLLGTEWYSVPK